MAASASAPAWWAWSDIHPVVLAEIGELARTFAPFGHRAVDHRHVDDETIPTVVA